MSASSLELQASHVVVVLLTLNPSEPNPFLLDRTSSNKISSLVAIKSAQKDKYVLVVRPHWEPKRCVSTEGGYCCSHEEESAPHSLSVYPPFIGQRLSMLTQKAYHLATCKALRKESVKCLDEWALTIA